ncbi:MAG: chemotaxis protein CheW [Gemmatimonadaceae bacterium]
MSLASTASPTDRSERRLLVVEAHGLLYGFDGEALREVVPLQGATRIPGAPPFVRGIMNVRGAMLTVIDFTKRVTDGQASLVEETASVVVVQGGGRLLGLAVDDVLDVQILSAAEVEPAPPARTGALARGLGHFGDRVVIIVDVNELVRQVLA